MKNIDDYIQLSQHLIIDPQKMEEATEGLSEFLKIYIKILLASEEYSEEEGKLAVANYMANTIREATFIALDKLAPGVSDYMPDATAQLKQKFTDSINKMFIDNYLK